MGFLVLQASDEKTIEKVVPKVCPVCQEKFMPTPDMTKEDWEAQTYCSRSCWRGWK